jgi:transcriptional regulator with XRE-family HTH domain
MGLLNERLAELRKSKSLKPVEVAYKVGISESYVSLIERGLRSPSYDVLLKFADLYGVTLDFILGREGAEK